MRKRHRYLIPSFIQSLTEYQPTESEDRDREQTEAHLIQGELVSDLLHYLYTLRFTGTDVIHPRVVKELVEELTEALSIIYQQA